MYNSDSQPLLKVESLRLTLRSWAYRPQTWRDVFTQLIGRVTALTKRAKQATAPGPERLQVLRDLSFTANQGDRIGIIGVNGAGKTSLCRCLAGLYVPTAGNVQVRGETRAIFDTAVGINPELTGRENAHLLSRLLYSGQASAKASVEEALEYSELGHFLDMPFKFYSNGMQSRLSLSLVSCRPSDLLILDEVFEGADAFFRQKISARVLKMIEASGVVIFTSHSEEEIRRVCNRVILLEGGKIAFDGDVDTGLLRYRNSGSGQSPSIQEVSAAASENGSLLRSKT